jgi:ABC-2 type transport system permease protein
MTSAISSPVPTSPPHITPGAERSLKNAVSLPQTLSNTVAMAWRGLLKIKRTPEQLFDVTFQPILLTVMFTYIFGGAIAGTPEDYLPFIVPGILVQTVIMTSIVTGVQLREDMAKGVFDRFRSLPIARVAPLAGALLADTVRYAIASLVTFATAFVMGYRPSGGLIGVLLASALVIVSAWSLSWIFAFFGVIARSVGAVQGISLMILFPLTFLSNAFVPVETLPGWLEWFVNLNPVSHLVTAARALTMTGTGGVELWFALLGSVLVVAVFAPLTVRAYMRKA